jgi:hypothetical protein
VGSGHGRHSLAFVGREALVVKAMTAEIGAPHLWVATQDFSHVIVSMEFSCDHKIKRNPDIEFFVASSFTFT